MAFVLGELLSMERARGKVVVSCKKAGWFEERKIRMARFDYLEIAISVEGSKVVFLVGSLLILKERYVGEVQNLSNHKWGAVESQGTSKRDSLMEFTAKPVLNAPIFPDSLSIHSGIPTQPFIPTWLNTNRPER